MADTTTDQSITGSDMNSRVFRRHPDVSFTRFGDEGWVVVPRGAWQVVLNETGLRIFELLDGRLTVRELAERLSADSEGTTTDEVVIDVAELLKDLAGKGAVLAVEHVH